MPTSCHNTLNHGLGHNLQFYICPWWVIIFKYFDNYHSDSPSARFKYVEVLSTSLWLKENWPGKNVFADPERSDIIPLDVAQI